MMFDIKDIKEYKRLKSIRITSVLQGQHTWLYFVQPYIPQRGKFNADAGSATIVEVTITN